MEALIVIEKSKLDNSENWHCDVYLKCSLKTTKFYAAVKCWLWNSKANQMKFMQQDFKKLQNTHKKDRLML